MTTPNALFPTLDSLGADLRSDQEPGFLSKISEAERAELGAFIDSRVSAGVGTFISKRSEAATAEAEHRGTIRHLVVSTMDKISEAAIRNFVVSQELGDAGVREKISAALPQDVAEAGAALEEIIETVIQGDFAMRKLSAAEAEAGAVGGLDELAALMSDATGEPIDPAEAEQLIAELAQLEAADAGVSEMDPKGEEYAAKESSARKHRAMSDWRVQYAAAHQADRFLRSALEANPA